MIPQVDAQEGEFLSSSDKTSNFGMETSPEAFAILSSQIYQFKVAAVVREYMCNACDGHSAIDSTEPFTVKLPSAIDPFFSVIDKGIGLDDDGVRNVFARYFKSTKKKTNKETGFLGLGAKSGYAYADSFTIIARKDGVERTYVAYFDESRIPALNMLGERTTSESNGVTISVPVDLNDLSTFRADVAFVASFTTITPIIEGGELWDDSIRALLDKDGWVMSQKEIPYSTSSLYRLNHDDVGVVMGGVVYPMSFQSVYSILSEMLGDDASTYADFFRNIRKRLFIQVGMGDVEFAASRESLSLTPRTKHTVATRVAEVIDIALEDIKKKVKEFDHPVEAYQYLTQTLNHIPSISWKGNFKVTDVKRSLFKIINGTLRGNFFEVRGRDNFFESRNLYSSINMCDLRERLIVIHHDCTRPGIKKYTREYAISHPATAYSRKKILRFPKKLKDSQISRLKWLFGLTDNDFVLTSSIIPSRKGKKKKSTADEFKVHACMYDIKSGEYHGADTIDLRNSKLFGTIAYHLRSDTSTQMLFEEENEKFSLDPTISDDRKVLRDMGIDTIIYMNKSNQKKIIKAGIKDVDSYVKELIDKYRSDAALKLAQYELNSVWDSCNLEEVELLNEANSIYMNLDLPESEIPGAQDSIDRINEFYSVTRKLIQIRNKTKKEANDVVRSYRDAVKQFAKTVDGHMFSHYPLIYRMGVMSKGDECRQHQINYIQLMDKQKENNDEHF